ncbi:transposase family protein [Streptomyces sp. NBC_01257]|nr:MULTISPECIES: transposase family protein [unclassified Streptomyces]WRZ69088.1 transposase family protein [Streptomyces sp. NBC_01257]WSU63036.1 transposase family protein [Streptomyces sp. NBC_01104]
MHYRTDLSLRQLAPHFGIAPATARRAIQRPQPLLAIELSSQPVADVERLRILDGTRVQVHDRTVAAPSSDCPQRTCKS